MPKNTEKKRIAPKAKRAPKATAKPERVRCEYEVTFRLTVEQNKTDWLALDVANAVRYHLEFVLVGDEDDGVAYEVVEDVGAELAEEAEARRMIDRRRRRD